MSELDQDIARLFEDEDAPRDPVFVVRVTQRIGWLRAIPALLAGFGLLAAAVGAFFAGPPLMESLEALSATFTPILASPWSASGLVIAGATAAGTFYLLQRARLSA